MAGWSAATADETVRESRGRTVGRGGEGGNISRTQLQLQQKRASFRQQDLQEYSPYF
jgi:hypothetical protein